MVRTNFDNLTPGTTPSVLTFLPSTVTATVNYASTGNGGDNTPGGTGQVARTTTSPAWNYLEIEMLSQLQTGDKIDVTLTLSQPVTNLSFKLHDIDTVSGAWLDQVIVNTGGFTSARGANVIGNGTTGNPFRNSTDGDNPISSGLGDVELTWAGPISVVQFTYRAGANGSSQNQHIGLGNISFTDCVANPNGVNPARAAVAKGMFAPGASVDLDPGRDN